jgi:hypothetical protein
LNGKNPSFDGVTDGGNKQPFLVVVPDIYGALRKAGGSCDCFETSPVVAKFDKQLERFIEQLIVTRRRSPAASWRSFGIVAAWSDASCHYPFLFQGFFPKAMACKS